MQMTLLEGEILFFINIYFCFLDIQKICSTAGIEPSHLAQPD